MIGMARNNLQKNGSDNDKKKNIDASNKSVARKRKRESSKSTLSNHTTVMGMDSFPFSTSAETLREMSLPPIATLALQAGMTAMVETITKHVENETNGEYFPFV